jgi:putative membrane protein
MMGYGWDGGGMGWGMWVFMAIVFVLFWAAIVGGIFLLVRYGRDRQTPPSPPLASGSDGGGDRARQVLDERFARGEIDQDEYVKRRDVLRSP